jgi:hypothetical protein
LRSGTRGADAFSRQPVSFLAISVATVPPNKEYLDSWVKRRVEALGTDGGREIGLQTYLRPLSGA